MLEKTGWECNEGTAAEFWGYMRQLCCFIVLIFSMNFAFLVKVKAARNSIDKSGLQALNSKEEKKTAVPRLCYAQVLLVGFRVRPILHYQ